MPVNPRIFNAKVNNESPFRVRQPKLVSKSQKHLLKGSSWSNFLKYPVWRNFNKSFAMSFEEDENGSLWEILPRMN